MKLNSEERKDYFIKKKTTRMDRQARKKNWVSTHRYCEECFYSLNDDEGDTHDNCFAASREVGRKVHPQMFKILKERKKKANGKDES